MSLLQKLYRRPDREQIPIHSELCLPLQQLLPRSRNNQEVLLHPTLLSRAARTLAVSGMFPRLLPQPVLSQVGAPLPPLLQHHGSRMDLGGTSSLRPSKPSSTTAQMCSQGSHSGLLRAQGSFPRARHLPVSPIFFRQVKQRFFFGFGFSEAVLPSAVFWDISSRVPETEARVLLPFLINQTFILLQELLEALMTLCVHTALADIPQIVRFALFHRDLHLTAFPLFQMP